MAKRNIGDEIVEGLEELVAWKKGGRKLRTLTVELPKAADVPQIRKKLGYSQSELASLLSVSLATLQNWEQGRREPQGAARSLLMVASTHPEAVKSSMSRLVVATKEKVKEPAKPSGMGKR